MLKKLFLNGLITISLLSACSIKAINYADSMWIDVCCWQIYTEIIGIINSQETHDILEKRGFSKDMVSIMQTVLCSFASTGIENLSTGAHLEFKANPNGYQAADVVALLKKAASSLHNLNTQEIKALYALIEKGSLDHVQIKPC